MRFHEGMYLQEKKNEDNKLIAAKMGRFTYDIHSCYIDVNGTVPKKCSEEIDDRWMDGGMQSDRWEGVSPLHVVSGTFKHLSFTVALAMSPLLSR